MREILRYCKKASDIPKEILPKIVKVVIKCRLGRGLSYCEGVSPAGKQLYEAFLGLLDDTGITYSIIALLSSDIRSKLQNKICQKHLISILNILRNVAVSERIIEAIDFMLQDVENAWQAKHKKEFREITKTFIKWK